MWNYRSEINQHYTYLDPPAGVNRISKRGESTCIVRKNMINNRQMVAHFKNERSSKIIPLTSDYIRQ